MKEEISLCKQIAGKHRRLIKYGDWFIIEDDPHELPALYFGQDVPVGTKLLPLWTISDCLEFFKEKGYRVNTDEDLLEKDAFCVKCYGHKSKQAIRRYGDTLLAACLELVLVMVEEKG